MSKFVFSREEEIIKDSTGSNYIYESGMYPVTINAVILKENDKKARSLNFWINYEGQDQMIFDAIRLDNNDGSANFQNSLFHKLAIIADLTEANPEEVSLPVGKEGAEETCTIFPEFCEMPVILLIQMEYTLYEGKIKEKKVIRDIFRDMDNATAEEIINNVPAKIEGTEQDTYLGKHYDFRKEKANIPTLKDGLTQEDISTWIKNGRGKNEEKKAVVKKSFENNNNNNISSRYRKKE